MSDLQVAANGTVFEVDHGTAGRLRLLRHPVRFPDTPATLRQHAPLLGEHTDAILREGGYSDDEIRDLRGRGAVAQKVLRPTRR